MGRVFDRAYAPSTLGSFLRGFSFGHVRQLDAVASRFLTGLADRAPLTGAAESDGLVLVDVDDTIIEVHGYTKQGSGYCYSGVRGLNALIATLCTAESAPVVVAQRLRKGSCGPPRGARRLVADALKTVSKLPGGDSRKPLLRADSAFYGAATIGAAIRGGGDGAMDAFSSKKANQRVLGRLVVPRIPDLNPKKADGQDTLFDT
jgi:hypothetical protein